MSDRHGRDATGGRSTTGHRRPQTDGLHRPSTKRLIGIATFAVLSMLMGQNLVRPPVVGWRRAEEALALQDDLARLRGRHVAFREEIEYRKTAAGQALTSAEILMLTYPGGRIVELVPKEQEGQGTYQPTLAERVKGWREKGRISFHRKWRVAALFLFDKWLPPERAT